MKVFEPGGAPLKDLERTWTGYVLRIAAADHDALASLYDASNRIVYGMALHMLGNPADAEEVTLDTYTQVWRGASHYDERWTAGTGPAAAGIAYIYPTYNSGSQYPVVAVLSVLDDADRAGLVKFDEAITHPGEPGYRDRARLAPIRRSRKRSRLLV